MKTPFEEIITKHNNGKNLTPIEFALMCLFEEGCEYSVIEAAANELQKRRNQKEQLIKENTRLRGALTKITKSFFHVGVEIAKKALEE